MRRSESEMLDLILRVAKKRENIRAVILQGSRVNSRVPKDVLQDYDVVYLVDDLAAITADHRWVDEFGDRLIMQMPETMVIPPPSNGGAFSYLMLFRDGNHIDLTIIPLAEWEQRGAPDSLSLLLLDKDKRFPPFPEPNDRDYHIRRPRAKAFSDCCNEFWWTSTYVAKGLYRREIPYAKAVMERTVRPMLDQMICWYIGVENDFTVNPGKNGRFFERYLPAQYWRHLLETYPDADVKNIWMALFRMGDLFGALAVEVAEKLDLYYHQEEAEAAKAYLNSLFPDQEH